VRAGRASVGGQATPYPRTEGCTRPGVALNTSPLGAVEARVEDVDWDHRPAVLSGAVRRLCALGALVTALVVVGCGSDDTDDPTPPGGEQTSTTAGATSTTSDDGY